MSKQENLTNKNFKTQFNVPYVNECLQKATTVIITEYKACQMWCTENGMNENMARRMLDMCETLDMIRLELGKEFAEDSELNNMKSYLAEELYKRLTTRLS